MMKWKKLRKKGQVAGIRTAVMIIAIFVMLGIVMPLINAAFEEGGIPTGQAEGLSDEVSQRSGALTSGSALDIVKSVAKMFVWTFGDFL